MQVNVYEAKARLSHLIERAMAGEEVIIAKHGRPVVQLIAVRDAFPEPGFMKGMAKATPDAFGPMSEQQIQDVFGCDI